MRNITGSGGRSVLHVTTGRPGYSPIPPPPVLKSLEPRLWDKLATLNIARKRRSGRRVSRIIRLPCSRGGGGGVIELFMAPLPVIG